MLPFLNSDKSKSKKYVVSFQGLNMGEGYAEGEFSTCENLSSVLAPCITQRFGRTVEAEFSAPTAIHAKGGLVVIDGTNVVYKGEIVGQVDNRRKQLATIGNYVIIFPDKVYLNVESGEFGSMEETYSAKGMVFTDSTITVSGANFKFHVGDVLTISGCTVQTDNNKVRDPIVRGVSGNTLTFYENTFIAGTETGTVTLKREVPDLDFICESNYRLWGTKGNTIFGSKYGDPFNFYDYDTGGAEVSYWIDVATDGEFTGCIPYSSHVCFFKENALHKLYGSKPSNFQIVTSQVYGVQAGSERSMCIINETLLYKGVGGVYAYTGSVPELISAKFGLARFAEACAASDGERYYISMKRGNDWHLFVYDVLRNIWLREDGSHCVDMAFHNGYVYLLLASGQLVKIDSEAEEQIEWSATLCPFNETMNERKGYSKFHLRLELGDDALLNVEIKRDNDTKWAKVYSTHSKTSKIVSIPVLPARCDSVEIRLSGKGMCKIRTLVREFFVGSDV